MNQDDPNSKPAPVPATLPFQKADVVLMMHDDMEEKERAYLEAKNKVLTIMTYELYIAGYGGRNDIHTQLKRDELGMPYMDITLKQTEQPKLVMGEPEPVENNNG